MYKKLFNNGAYKHKAQIHIIAVAAVMHVYIYAILSHRLLIMSENFSLCLFVVCFQYFLPVFRLSFTATPAEGNSMFCDIIYNYALSCTLLVSMNQHISVVIL